MALELSPERERPEQVYGDPGRAFQAERSPGQVGEGRGRKPEHPRDCRRPVTEQGGTDHLGL